MSSFRQQGFTLIELLVVISIIALLIAILLPSLDKARFTALNLQCASIERQVSLAGFFYANDNDQDIRGSGGTGGWQPLYINKDSIWKGCPLRNKHIGRQEYTANGKYSYNGNKASWANDPWRLKPFSQAKYPSQTYFVAEWRAGAFNAYNETKEAWEWVALGWGYKKLEPIHRQIGSNWIFIDGHGEFKKINLDKNPTYWDGGNPRTW